MNKKWGYVSKDPGLGGPLGGLCNIPFPMKYYQNTRVSTFFPQNGILNKSIIQVVLMSMCMNVAREYSFIYRWDMPFFSIFAHIFFNHAPHMTQVTCYKLNKCSNLVQLLYVKISMMSFNYPRPVLAFGCCHRLHLCVFVCESVVSISCLSVR